MIPELQPIWHLLETKVFHEPSTSELFNQYKDVELEFDVKGADAIRRRNFKNYFESFERTPPSLVVGEAPSYCGMRFSGVARSIFYSPLSFQAANLVRAKRAIAEKPIMKH